MKKEQEKKPWDAVLPTRVDSIRYGDSDEEYNHDAFGVVTLTLPQGGGKHLFGSDIEHNQRVCISISRANWHRAISNDWIHSDGRPIVEIELSHAQFAQFITSQGNGSGTPCTFRIAPPRGTIGESMPQIAKLESKADLHRREIHESSSRYIKDIQNPIDRLGEMLESGKLSVKAVRELHREMVIRMNNLPRNMEFTVRQAEEALDKATSDAKIEVESFIHNAINRIGMATVKDFQQMLAQKAPIEYPQLHTDHE